MNKSAIMIGAVGGMMIGSVVPWLWGDYNTFGIASALLSMAGGFLGILLVAIISKRLS